MQASARNQLQGVVRAIVPGAVNAEVELDLNGGDKLVASITCESLRKLALTQGMSVIALVKAPHVMIVTDFGGFRLSARNQLQGIVTYLRTGVVDTEVTLQLPGGETIVATITNESSQNMLLRKGHPATAVFKAGSVILAVPL